MQREDMLAELQSQYSTGQMTREVAGDRSAAELFKIYAAMNKPQAGASGRLVAGSDNVPFDPSTGAKMYPVPAEYVYRMRDFLAGNPDPVDVAEAFRNFDNSYGYGAAKRYFGER